MECGESNTGIIMNIKDKAFKDLTDKQREVWILVMQRYFTEHEAAKHLGLTRDAVHDRLNKARRRFTKYIQENRYGAFVDGRIRE
jgi:DNA-directed RNA polymerase specialized sigma24 family protein